MPNFLNPTPIKVWLRERDWDYQRLADECNRLPGLDPGTMTKHYVRNVVNGYDPVGEGRANRIALVTRAHPTPSYPTGLTYDELVRSEDAKSTAGVA